MNIKILFYATERKPSKLCANKYKCSKSKNNNYFIYFIWIIYNCAYKICTQIYEFITGIIIMYVHNIYHSFITSLCKTAKSIWKIQIGNYIIPGTQ